MKRRHFILSGLSLASCYSFAGPVWGGEFNTFKGGKLAQVPAAPDRGFHWPYFLFVPDNVNSKTTLIVQGPNNIITDDQNKLNEVLLGLLDWMTFEYGEKTSTPFLMPAFIRPPNPGILHELRGRHDNLDTHSLRRDALITKTAGLQRIDLQILAMIDDARARLSRMQIDAEDKIIFTGWSAAGSLADRLTAMHPTRVKALVVGGFGATPMLPIAQIDGESFDYPIGIGDLEHLIGKPFDLGAYKDVPYLLQHGTADPNDPIPNVDPFGKRQRRIVKRALGQRPMDRIDKIRSIFADVGKANFELRLYPDVDHSGSREIAVDINQFLIDHVRTN